MRKGLTLTLDAEGNVIVAGPMRDDAGPSSPLFVAKLDQSGRILWRQILERDAPPWGFIASECYDDPGRASSDDLRDSVSPLMIDGSPSLAPARGGKFRRVVGVAVAALLLCLGIGAAGAAQGELALGAPARPMRSGLGATLRGAHLERSVEPPAIDARSMLVELKRVPMPSAEAIRTEAVALLSAGKPAEALPLARALTVAAPFDAFSYLCLGSALLDLGRRDEALQAFGDCVRHATEGAVAECRALGGKP